MQKNRRIWEYENLTKYEMETVVNYNVAEQMATVYTRDKSVMRRLDRFVADQD